MSMPSPGSEPLAERSSSEASPPIVSGVRRFEEASADAWPMIEAAVLATLSTPAAEGPERRDRTERRRAPLERLFRAIAPSGGVARVRPHGTSDEGDAIAAALFEAGVRAIEIAPGLEPRELIGTIEAIAACVRHAAKAPFEPRRPRLPSEHVELRTTPVGERGDAVAREAQMNAAREIEAAALTTLLRARSTTTTHVRRRASDAGARFSRASWEARFAELGVDAAIAEVRASTEAPTPSSVALPRSPTTLPPTSSPTAAGAPRSEGDRRATSRPALPAHALASLARRQLDEALATAVRSWLEGALDGPREDAEARGGKP
jgi:hypothetical protein